MVTSEASDHFNQYFDGSFNQSNGYFDQSVFTVLWHVYFLLASSNFNPRKDMVFVMDRSGSVGRHHFNLQKTFIKQLIEYFDISRSKTLVAIVTFASNVKLVFDFNKYPNKECLRNGIENIGYGFRKVFLRTYLN